MTLPSGEFIGQVRGGRTAAENSALEDHPLSAIGNLSDRPMILDPMRRPSKQDASVEMNMQSLFDKNVIVLGASRGLGAMIAQRAAAEGARTLAVARSRHWLNELAQNAGDVDVLELDASEEGAPEKVFGDRIPALLVVCGGARPHAAPIHEMSWEQFSANWENDVKTSFLFCKAALSRPLAPGSVVILMSSGAALGGSPISGGYAGAKRMQMLIANYCQKESDRLGLGIRFLALAPAMIMPGTDFGRYAVEGYAEYLGTSVADFINSMKSPQTPEDVVAAVFELAAHPDAWVGSVFKIDSDGIARAQ
jgi:NAD(P)-dependent dehydrogenase (short-subunit alcohol dehydrogenase family)